jgi:hypothetical protein
MRTYRTKSGPFKHADYYSDEEIELLCLDELQRADLLPASAAPIRIDRFVEKRFGVTPQYDDLGDGVLGLTVFGPKGVQAVIMARSLDEEKTKVAERRIRSTIAHEAGHGLLHAHLFVLQAGGRPLFGDFSDPQRPKVLCRDTADSQGRPKARYDGKWWEFQANTVMGSLLLPRPLVEQALEPFLVERGSLGGRMLDNTRREEATRHLSEIFDTNPVVARFRLDRLYPATNEMQLSL